MNKQELIQKIADELHEKMGDPNRQGNASCLSAEAACLEAAKIAVECAVENTDIHFTEELSPGERLVSSAFETGRERRLTGH
jgi:hypothetical protein